MTQRELEANLVKLEKEQLIKIILEQYEGLENVIRYGVE